MVSRYRVVTGHQWTEGIASPGDDENETYSIWATLTHTDTHVHTRHDSFREKQTNAATDSRLFKGVDSNECTGRTRTRIVTTFIRNKHSGGDQIKLYQ